MTFLEISEKAANTRGVSAKDIIANSNFIFYFTFNNDIFGGDEISRVTFARLRSSEDYGKDISFTAVNPKGENKLFTHKDISNIKIIDKDTAIKLGDELATF